MNVGYVGLGKLGLPCALATEAAGHKVVGYDVNPAVAEYIEQKQIPYMEVHVNDLLPDTRLELKENVFEVVADSDIVFVPVQTPHDPKFEGITPIPEKERKDFDYTHLKSALHDIALACAWQKKRTVVVIISTVLPGTIEREIKPLLNDYVDLVYNPFFIAMGTTIDDYRSPEFVLVGSDSEDDSGVVLLKELYSTIHDRPVFVTNIATAELTKVAYNTFIGMKIVFANTMMEICEKSDADVDSLADALELADQRIISPKYMRGGMGDGGGCHPRDNIAMSWLAGKLEISHDIFTDLMKAREDQNKFFYNLIRAARYAMRANGVVDPKTIILGKAYKPETNLTIGSPSMLLYHHLGGNVGGPAPIYSQAIADGVSIWDPYVDGPRNFTEPAIFFIGTRHAEFAEYKFPEKSIVIDPFGYIPDQEGVVVKRVGRA